MFLDKDELFNKITSITDWKTVGDDVQYSIFTVENYCYLVFQQSASKRDWQVNFNFPAKVYKNQESCLRVARGWGNAYKSCNDEIMKDFISHINDNLIPVICGWSYGGAMAVIAAEDFYFRSKIKAIVITYGAPKPLFGKKCRNYVYTCVLAAWQYTHINDCVTLLPPFIGYTRLNTSKIGRGFSLCKLFKPEIYHCIYGHAEEYIKDGE